MNLDITGGIGIGKTTWCARYLDRLKLQGASTGGILCLAIFKDGLKTGYDVKDLRTGETAVFARINPLDCFSGKMVGKYLISDDGLAFAQQAIRDAVGTGCDVVAIDELGYLELASKGLADNARLAYSRALNTVSVVRKSLLVEFVRTFSSALTSDGFIIQDIGLGEEPESSSIERPPSAKVSGSRSHCRG